MSLYRTVIVTPTLTENNIIVSPVMSENNIRAPATMANKIRVNNTSDYDLLMNKPQIESVELIGNKSFNDLGLSNISNMRLEQLLSL